jgi:alanyl-tRNA synthetase
MSVLHLGQLSVTTVTFPHGSLRETATVEHVLSDVRTGGENRCLVITDVTPFHPLDPLWPDQPADHGELRVGEETFAVQDTVTLALRDNQIMVGDQIDARRGEAGVVFLVAHVVEVGALSHVNPGARVVLVVDEARRRRLSAAHTGCHLLAYALNEVTHDLWRKPTAVDSRGHHDLDAATCVSTRHDVDGSLDHYRLGKSLRKRGFDAARFLDELPAIVESVNRILAGWIEADSPVRVDVAGPALTDRRQWVCETPGGTAQMPCGGTHVRRLGEIAAMTAAASYDADSGTLEIRNHVRVTR